MDVPRKTAGRRKALYWTLSAAAVFAVILAISRSVASLEPAVPVVERSSVLIDTVKRGEMLRQVRGLGALVPEEILWVPSTTDGRVDSIKVRAGARVHKKTLLMVLSNPQLENDALDAQYQLKAAEAGSTDLRVRLQSTKLEQQASTAQLKSDYALAQIEAEKQDSLVKLGLAAEINSRISRTKADEFANRYSIEKQRLDINDDSIRAQLAAQAVQVDKLRALYRLRRSQVEALKVRAGTEGVLAQVPVEVGQRLAAGTILAKISQPSRLKAELKIPETQAKDILIGQAATIDTHNGVIPGRVIRMDPGAVNGTVTVDVQLEGALPAGARPDLSVDGSIELERLRDILYVGRPVFGQPNSVVSLFKVDAVNNTATRIQVKLGRVSVNTIEIVDGLKVGDQVILSDMAQHDAHPRVRLN